MRHTLCIILLFLSVQASNAQSYSKETQEKIRAVENSLAGRVKIDGQPDYNIVDRMKHYGVKGVSIAVVHDFKVVWAKGYGWANEEEKKKVTPETLFEPGSISKSLNAVGILKLAQDKKLDLYTDINTYLTSWKFPYDSVSKNKKITLAQLLSHSAGLTVHGFPGYDLEEKRPTVPQILDGTPPTNTPPVRSMFEPGLRSEYSGGGTTISQLLITDLTKQPYDVFMYENVLKPIGMGNSFYTQPPAKDKLHLCATGYNADGSAVNNKFHVYPEQAAAGLWMTPTDLCNYIVETQLAYQGKSSKVLNQEMTKLRLTPYNDQTAALGVFVEKHNTTTYFEHGAGNWGFSGQYFGSLEDGNGVAVFINSDKPGLLPEIVNSVATVYNWPDFYTPLHKKVVTVPESILQAYPGVYLYDDRWASILKKDNTYYMVADGIYSKMYFTTPNNFFNMEFSSEKEFVRNENGMPTGYKRKAGNRELTQAVKVNIIDTLHLPKEQFNEIGWHFLENKDPSNALPYLERGLALSPGDLLISGNLAHSYLFIDRYQAAINMYKVHLNENIAKDVTWQQMIQQDFMTFKQFGYDVTVMNKALAELGIPKPKGF
jgi:CubicO group peptidase (beta-lactamase class C family)